jgi:hypothetical protein
MKETDRPGRAVPSAADQLSGDHHRAFLTLIQRFTNAGIWLHVPATGETWWSDQVRQLCGVGGEDVSTISDLVSRCTEETEPVLRKAFDEAIEDQTRFDVRVEFVNDGQGKKAVQICCEPWSTNGRPVLLGVIQDVTEKVRKERRIKVLRKTSQQLKRANSRQAVAEILANASKNILGLVNTTIRFVDGNEGTLRTVVATEECVERAGQRPNYSIAEETPAARTYRTGEPEIHRDHETTDDEYDRGKLRSGLYVPIGDMGVLSAGDVTLDAFDEQDLEAAGLLGQLGAEALKRIGLTKRSRAI